MAKSIFLVLFVLGVAQALAVPVQDSNQNEKSKEYYREIGMVFIGALSEEVHKVQKTDNRDSHQNKPMETNVSEIPIMIAEMSHILPDEEHHKVKRAVNEIKNRLEKETIPAIGELAVDMAQNGANETSANAMKDLMNEVENGMNSLGSALDDDEIKNFWKFLCSFFSDESNNNKTLTEDLVNATELVEIEQPKSFAHKACSEKTYKKTQDLIQNAKRIFKTINDFFTKERLDIITQKLKVVSQKVKQAAKAVYGNNPSAGHIALTTARFLNPIVGIGYQFLPRKYKDSIEKKLG